jgi:hypothetical protein
MPDDSFLRFDDADKRNRLLPVLIEVYKHESTKVSGSSGGVRRFSDCIWTRDEMLNAIAPNLTESEAEVELLLDELIGEMVSTDEHPNKRHMLRFPIEEVDHHITRVAEMIRTVTCLHEYTNREVQENGENVERKFPIVAGARWEPRLRYGVSRIISPAQIITAVRASFGPTHRLPQSMGGHPIATALEDLKQVLAAVNHVIANGNLMFSQFQQDAIVKAFNHSWTEGYNSALVLTAGTGMGKTLGFAIPVITDALIVNRAGGRQCSQLLMYPRNDLAKDQFQQITDIVKRLNHNFISNGEPERCLGTALDADGRIVHHQPNFPSSGPRAPAWGAGGGNTYVSACNTYAGDNPSSIIACSIESFRRRLRIPEVCSSLRNGLRRVVLDEIHLSVGIQGGHHSRILSRCRQLIYPRRDMTFIGVSATIAKPREHAAKIWLTNEERAGDVDHVDSEVLDQDSPMGIRHHIMIRPRKGTSPIGTLVDMTSAVTHQRRTRNLHDRPTNTGGNFDYEKLQKTVGFADSHEIVGSWYSYMLDNESTSHANRLENDERRPYAHWHERPLQIHPGGEAICNSCQLMKHHDKPITVANEHLRKFRYRPDETLDNAKEWHLPMYPDGGGSKEIRGLETCHHLQSGTCWWFAPRTGEAEPRPDDPGHTSYRDVIRVKRHTGQTNSSTPNSESAGEAKADYSFKEIPRNGAYPRGGNYEQNSAIPHDVAIATPTLEVGVDMSNVSDILTHKAIRNVSSYRQKVGRGGREPGTDAIAMTLMSYRRQEFQYYRSMFRLVDAEILDPVPVANNNIAMMKNEAYDCVFDYITRSGHRIEYIPTLKKAEPGDSEYSDWVNINNPIIDAIAAICDIDADGNPIAITSQCDAYVRWGASVEDPEIRKDAAFAVAKHLGYFLEEMPVGGVTVLQYLVSWHGDLKLDAMDVNLIEWKNIKDLMTSNPANLRPKLDPNDFELFDDFIGKIQEMIDNSDVQGIRDVLDDMELWADDIKNPVLNSFVPILKLMAGNLTVTPPVHPICEQVKGLKPFFETRYLSLVMFACPIFRKDAPYATLETLFKNPHEAPLTVRFGAGAEYITAKEALQYTLPGMWTHRLFGAKRLFVTHRGSTTQTAGTAYKLHLDGAPSCPGLVDLGPVPSSDIARVSPLLDLPVQDGIKQYRLEVIRASEDSFSGEPNSMPQAQPPYSGFYYRADGKGDVQNGFGGNTKRPRAHSVSWQISDASEETDQSRIYKIANTRPAFDGEPETLEVTKHPLLSVLFDKIEFDDKMKVKRMALGVTRTNQIVLQNYYNEAPCVLIDEFYTHGLRFNVKNEILNRAFHLGSNSEHPFDDRIIRMLGAWMRERKDLFTINSFQLEMLLDIIVDEAWRQSNGIVSAEAFPETAGQFFNLLFGSGNDWDSGVFARRVHQDAIASDNIVEDAEQLQEAYSTLCIHAAEILADYPQMMGDWYQSTMLNTLGLALSEAVSEFAGVPGDAVSYTYEHTGDVCYIDVFDDDAEGNGSTELANKYIHIPIEVRELAQHFQDVNLPTSSFTEIIEDRLRMCEEHMLHSIAIEGKLPEGVPRWMNKEATELISRFATDRWAPLGITGTRLATLQNRRRFAFVDHGQTYNTELLNYELALSMCDVGCDACNGDDFGNLFPPNIVQYSTCRAVLDDVLGDWTDYDGYLRKDEHRLQLQSESGNPVDSDSYIHIIGDWFGAMAVRQRFMKYPCPPIGLSWQRSMSVPDRVDKYVRYQEVL